MNIKTNLGIGMLKAQSVHVFAWVKEKNDTKHTSVYIDLKSPRHKTKKIWQEETS